MSFVGISWPVMEHVQVPDGTDIYLSLNMEGNCEDFGGQPISGGPPSWELEGAYNSSQ